MKFLYKWIGNKIQGAMLQTAEPYKLATVEPTSSIESRGMNFTVYRANGGYVIEHRTYNRKTDQSSNSLHIITDDKELGEEIGKIITFESIRS